MNRLKISKLPGVPGLLAFAVLVASFSAAADESAWYLGGNGGLSTAEIDDKRIIGGLLSEGFTSASISNDDERDVGYKLFGGYQFTRYLALEAGYFDLGEFGFEAATEPTGLLSGDIKLRGVNLDAVGMLPFTDRFSAFGRAGVNYAEAKVSFSGSGAVNVPDPRREERAAHYKVGLGLEYDLTESLALRAEAERYRISDAVGNDGDVDFYSMGLVYRFAGNSAEAAPAPLPSPAPAPKEMAPLLSSPLVVAPAPASRRVSFSADSLFDFDKAVVNPAGRQELDKFAAELKGTRFDVITVTGHTDRIGSQAYNLELSMRRAAAVRDYLSESAGIPAAKIVVRGINGSEPVTKPGECKGTVRTRQLIACLQPDRRVEVEVTGSK